jgi:hypothetical protein
VGVPAEEAEEYGSLRRRGRKEQPRELRRGLGRDGAPVEADSAERRAVGDAGEAREDAVDEVRAEAAPDGHRGWVERGPLLENAAVMDGGV